METIKGAVDTASKVLFGDQAKTGQNVEPQSGVTGNTTRGEPYDGGNIGQSSLDIALMCRERYGGHEVTN